MKNEEANRAPRKRDHNMKCETNESIARLVDQKFKEYRAFDDYVRHEVDRQTKDMHKNLKISAAAISLAVAVCGYFGGPALIQKKVGEYLETATSQASLSVISNLSASIVHKDVPKMISESIESSVKVMKAQIDEIKRDEDSIREELRNASGAIQKASRSEAEIVAKLALIDAMVAARAGDRRSYEELLSLSTSTNQNATLAKNAVAEIDWRYQQRRYSVRNARFRLQRPDLQLSNADFVSIIHADNDWNCDGAINELVDTNDKGFVETLVYAVMTSKRLDSVDTAIEGLQALTGRSFKALGIDEVSKWWAEAKTNAVYHSGYEQYHELIADFQGVKGSVPVDQILKIINKARDLTKEHPNLSPAWRLITILISALPEGVRFSDGRQELCESAFSNYEKHVADKADACLLNIYLSAKGLKDQDVIKLTNDAIAKYADFEVRARKSHLFTDSFFSNPAINWRNKIVAPEQAHQTQTTTTTAKAQDNAQSTLIKTLPRGIETDTVVGYMPITIRKGQRALLELPVNKNILQVKNTLVALGGSVDGDVISWTINERSYAYAYHDEHWRNDAGDIADDINVPVGDAIIYYDRKADVETRLTFCGQFNIP